MWVELHSNSHAVVGFYTKKIENIFQWALIFIFCVGNGHINDQMLASFNLLIQKKDGDGEKSYINLLGMKQHLLKALACGERYEIVHDFKKIEIELPANLNEFDSIKVDKDSFIARAIASLEIYAESKIQIRDYFFGAEGEWKNDF